MNSYTQTNIALTHNLNKSVTSWGPKSPQRSMGGHLGFVANTSICISTLLSPKIIGNANLMARV